jgi:hypothetical protein
MEWVDAKEKTPNEGQNVIAIGTWFWEINGIGKSDYMGIGTWNNGEVHIDSDTYSTEIWDITHWMPLPEWPNSEG